MRQLNEQNINIYDFPLTEDPQVDWMREQLPFAVVGSNTIIQVSAVVGYRSVLWWGTGQCCGGVQARAVVGSNTIIQVSALVSYGSVLW